MGANVTRESGSPDRFRPGSTAKLRTVTPIHVHPRETRAATSSTFPLQSETRLRLHISTGS